MPGINEIVVAPPASPPRGEIVELRPVRVVQILNPFRPATERRETELDCVPGEYVWQTLERAGLSVAEKSAVTVNGHLLTTAELSTACTRPGDWITIAFGVDGGVWKSLAMIGLMVAASLIAPVLAPALIGVVASATGSVMSATLATAIIGGAIVAGGNLLISAFSGMFQSNVSALTATQTYNPAGPSTTAQPGGVIPKGYGVMGWGGNIVSSFVNFDGTNNEYVNILVAFGMGQAAAIENILVNGKPVFGYRELTYQVRLGTNDQTPIFGFNQTVNGYPQDIEMLAADPPIVVPGTGTQTQALQVSVKFPGGLIRYDNNGNPKEVSYAYQLQYSVDDGSGTYTWQPVVAPRDTYAVTTVDTNGFVHYPYWIALPTDRYQGDMIIYDDDINADNHSPGDPYSATTDVKVYSIDASNYTYPLVEVGEWQPFDANNPLQLSLVVDWWSGYRIVSQMTTTPFYDNVSILGLTPNKYAVQVTFWGAGPHDQPIPPGDVTDTHYTAQGWLWNINEITFTDFSYPNSILVGIRALSTSQLSGQNMQVMATITHDIGEDTQLPPELASFEHDNPAIVAFDIINNPLYGMGLPWSSVDIPAFLAWANFCDEQVTNSLGTQQRRFVFAGVFDQSGNAWSALQKVAQMSRSQIVRVGGMYSVVMDAPSEPVQIFTVGNIKEDSLEESWISLDERANLVEVTFSDALRNYRSDLPVSVIGAAAVNSLLPPKTTRVSLLGCTNRDQAWQWAYFQLLSTQTLLRMISIKCPVEAVTCQMGSVIGVQHDVPQWGWGGRVQSGSTATAVNIDRTDLPPFVAGAGWTLSVQHPNVSRGTATITGTSVDSNGESFVTLNAVPSGRLLLMVSQSGLTQAKVFAMNAPALQNPNFTLGAVGWSLGTGWEYSGSGGGFGYSGSDAFAIFTGTGSAPMANLSPVACTPGTVVTAACQVQGSSGTTGSCTLLISFYDEAGTLISSSAGNAPAANATWIESSAQETAPAGTSYVTIGAQASNVTTGSWSVGGFAVSLSGVVQVSVLGDMAVGQTVTLYDQNVIDIVLVASVDGETVTLQSPLSQAPVPDSPWIYGQSQGFQPATLFRVTDLRQTSDFEVTIKGLEYNSLIYEDQIPTYGEVVSAPTVNASVSNVTLVENFQTPNPNNPTVSLVSVGWSNGPNTVGALIYMRPSNLYYPTLPTAQWSLLANVKGTQYSFWAAQDSEIEVQVVGFDNLGNPAPQTTAPTATLTVLGPGGLPPSVTTFALNTANVPPFSQSSPGPQFTWTSVDGVSGYEIRFLADNFKGVGSDWATASVLADIAPASAAGVPMSWTAPNNLYGTYLLASYQLVPTVASAPPTYKSSAFTTPQAVVYGTIQDWQPVVFGTGRPSPFGGSKSANLYTIAQAGATGQQSVLLQNPNFVAGNVGWSLQAGWSIVAGTGANGSGYLAEFQGPGTAAIANLQSISCGPGAVLSAWCMASNPASVSNQSCVRLNFYNGTGTVLLTATGNTPTAGGGFLQSRVVGTAPSGTAYATVDYAVIDATASDIWQVESFGAAIHLNNIGESPDGNGYAKTLSTALTGGQVDLAQPGVINKTASNIAYGSGATVESLQPAQPGADVTSQNTSKDTSAVNGQPSATVAQGATAINKNLVPDSSLQFGWTYWKKSNSASAFGIGFGDAGMNEFRLYSATQTTYADEGALNPSVPVPVEGGATYTLSAFINVLSATAPTGGGYPGLYLYSVQSGAELAQCAPAPGSAPGRYSVIFTVPTGTTTVYLCPQTRQCTCAAGFTMEIGAMMLQQGSVVTAYVPNVIDEQTGQWLHGAMSAPTQQAIDGSGNVQNLGGVAAGSITPVANVMPIEANSDGTVNRTKTLEFSFPSANVDIAPNTASTIATFSIDSSGTSDVFNVWITLESNSSTNYTMQVTVDGSASFGLFVPLYSAALFMGSISGLSAGTHTLAVVVTNPDPSIYADFLTDGCIAMIQQFAGTTGFLSGPVGRGTIQPASKTS